MNRLLTVALIVNAGLATARANDFTQFRGPDGQGHSTFSSAPLTWSDDSDNIAWKADVPGLGWSSPVVADGVIWLTTASDDGQSLRVIRIDATTGSIVGNVEVFANSDAGRIHKKNSFASPTPVIDGDRVFVHFGAFGTACLSADGKVLWLTPHAYKMVHGPGGSPVVHDDLVIVSCDGGDVQFVIAMDRNTGEIRWKTDRPSSDESKKFAFSTPLVIDVNGQHQLVSPGAGRVCAYDPTNGRLLWHFDYPGGYSVVPRPVFGHGLVYVSSSYDRPTLYAIRVDGENDGEHDVTESHLAWKADRGAPHNPSPLIVGDDLYLVSDRGIASCLDAKTGESHWQERLDGNFSASPLFVAGRIYFLDEDGTTTVIAPGHDFNQLAKNRVTGRTLASLVPIDGGLLLRTDSQLIRINHE